MMSKKVQIKVMDNGGFRVTGDVELIDMEGNPFNKLLRENNKFYHRHYRSVVK